jgi:hypothetical protein
MVRCLGIVVVLVACSKSSDEAQTKQWQEPAPPKNVTVPEGVSIAVDVDGAAKPAITSDTLKSVKPDFVDPEHHAWLIGSLVPDAAAAGTVVEASAPSGVSVKLAHPTPDGFEPVLFLTRRGELTARAIDPKDPFPKWEGQGGRVHRPGDSLPHLGPVAKLAITRPTR